jgi:type IV pilus assembly protein PilY1
MDNILYGIKDPDFPYFKHLNGVEIPRENVSNFLVKAHEGANAANRIFPSADINYCLDKTGETSGNCPNAEAGWVIHLDTADDMKFRKMSGSPKLFKGQVYYPVYRPPVGQNKCNVGLALIFSTMFTMFSWIIYFYFKIFLI